jgi:outer membrane protein TolC
MSERGGKSLKSIHQRLRKMKFFNLTALCVIAGMTSACILKDPSDASPAIVSDAKQPQPKSSSEERVALVFLELSRKATDNFVKTVKIDKNLNFFNAVHSAVKASPQIERAAQQVLSAGFGKDIAVSGKNVQFKASGGVGVSAQRKNSATTDTAGAAITVQGAVVLFDGGLIDSQIDASEAQYLVAETNLDVESEKIAYDSASAWIKLWSATQAQDLLSKNKGEIDAVKSQLEILKATGILNVGEFANIENEMNDLALTEQKTQQLMDLTKADFQLYFGDVTQSLRAPPLSQLISRNTKFGSVNLPTLKKLLLEQAIAEFRVNETKASLKPTVKSVASLSSPQNVNGSSDAKIGIFVDYIIGDGGRRAARIAAAEADFLGLEAEIGHQLKVAEVAFNTAKARLNSNQSLIKMFSKKIKLLDEQIKTATSQKTLGQTAIQKLFTLKIEKFDAQMDLIKLRGETYIAALDLNFASGSLLELFDL